MARSFHAVFTASSPRERAAFGLLLFILSLPLLSWGGLIAIPDLLPSRYYHAFHSTTEMFTVWVAMLVFATGFHVRDRNQPAPSAILACGFLGVGVLDFLHLLSFTGLPDLFTANTPHKSIVLWQAGQLLGAGTLLAHVLATSSPPAAAPPRHLLLAGSLLYVAVFGSIGVFRPEWIPATFVPGQGPTSFKIALEGLAAGTCLAALALVVLRRDRLPRAWILSLVPALLLLVASSMFFIRYVVVTDALNLLGHIYKVFAYLFLYHGVFTENVRQPFTQLESAYRAVRLAKQEWTDTIDALPDLVLIHDQNFRIQRCNRAYATAAGLPFHLIIGRPYYEVYPRGSGPLSGHASAGQGSGFEQDLYLAHSGLHYNLRCSQVTDERGNYLHSFLVLRDITTKKLMEEELRDTTERLTALIENIPDGIQFKDGAGRWLVINEQARHLFRLDGIRWQGRTGQELAGLCPDLQAAHQSCLESDEKAWRTGKMVLSEERMADGAGGFSDFEVRKVPLFEPDGRRKALVVIGRDVSEAKKAEKSLRESQRFLSSVLESIQDGLGVLDPDLTISHVNGIMRGWCRDQDSPVGRKCYEAFAGRARPCRPCPALRCVATGQAQQDEVCGPPGSARQHLELYCYPVKDPETGEVLRVVNFIRDITARKQLEARMLQTGKMEALGVLAGGIAHDFNNILTPIMMHAEMVLQDTAPGSLHHQQMELVKKAAERASGLVRQILDFSRQGRHEPQPLKLGLIVKEALKFLRATIPEGIEVHCELRAERDLVAADPDQMLQVLMNLAVNAAQAMGEEGGRLLVSLEAAPHHPLPDAEESGRDNPWLKLKVSDTGQGIPPEIVPKIFDPFFTTKEKGEGTGMGLAVVHGIVTRHGGAISVHSTVGAGTTFEILLPGIPAVHQEHRCESPALAAGRERILFVDDEQEVAAAAAAMLERLGYSVTAVTGSLEAFDLLRSQPLAFDLVITDSHMPRPSGLWLAGKVKALRPEVPVILCTGLNRRMHELASIGISAVVAKPFRMHEISAAIRRVMDGRADSRQVN